MRKKGTTLVGICGIYSATFDGASKGTYESILISKFRGFQGEILHA